MQWLNFLPSWPGGWCWGSWLAWKGGGEAKVEVKAESGVEEGRVGESWGEEERGGERRGEKEV